jgi:NAD+ synthase (glutamine-hydrolysing)
MKISLNQINTVSGDIKGNFKKVYDKTTEAFKNGSDIAVFPETAFTGYCIGALWDNIDFIFEQENCVRDLMRIVPYNKCVIVGYISYHGTKPDGFPLLKNSVAVINKNTIQRYDKQLLANADHHEDKKYFKPGKKTKIFNLFIDDKEVTIGTPICEDVWYINHNRNIPKEMVEMGAEILISINQSYFYYNKLTIRENLFEKISSTLNVPFISVNSVGVGDIVKNIIIFDGSSMVYDNDKKYIQMKRFQEDTIDVKLVKTHNKYKVDQFNIPIEYYDTEKPNKYDEIIDAISFEQKELFSLLNIPKAQVHVSGGVDSAIGMALSILSMGKENCVFITNPTSLNSDSLPIVKKMGKNFGVEIHTNELEEIYQIFNKKDTENFGSELNKTGQATIQAVLRTVQGLAACHRFKSGIVACGNHTEIVLGWASFHDVGSIGVHSPIGDLTKLELFELCKHINKRFHSLGYTKHVIPEDLFNGKIIPAAELPDSKYDPIDYYIQSGLCAEIIRNKKTKKQLISDFENKNLTADFFPKDIYKKYTMEQFISEVDFTLRKSRISVFKAAQGAPIVILSPRSRGFSNRETIINKYQ